MMPTLRFTAEEIESDLIRPETLVKAVDLFKDNGFLYIENAFSPAFIKTLYAGYASRYKRYFRDRNYADAHEVAPLRYQVTVKIEPPFNSPRLYANPLMLPILQQLLGETCTLDGVGSMISLPGSREQLNHRDLPGLFQEDELNENIPSYAITYYVPLIDLTEHTGTTRMWPGTHRVWDDELSKRMPSVDPLMPIGGSYLMDYRLRHAGLANRSDLVRPLMYLVYKRPWWSDWLNYKKQYGLEISDKEYQGVPEAYRGLFPRRGYGVSAAWWQQKLQLLSKKNLKRRYRRNPVLRFAKSMIDQKRPRP